MKLTDMKARVGRLEELARGFAKEAALCKGGNDPLLYQERKSYMKAIQDALVAVEAARVAMVQACQRLQQAKPQ